ncbi:PAS domain-containing protein [Flavobacterium cellulosilyticum]|uniref:histidine kinase n=1 Tax=Flavobacterium cellulosilyticum TaxID=2541731 RepID=A0A4R5CGU0_9FLAO|nr:PAS domain-containing protein [Flavobacterium cellulosilyticum]TDD96482.1 PAS domain S-box protein [Flavobacterium cellulosilyticum]
MNESNLFYIIVIDMDGNYSYINNNYAKVFSHINNNFIGQPYHITMHPDDMNTCLEVSTKCFENPDKLFLATIRKHNGEGGYVYTQWEYKAMFDDKKNPAGIFCIGHNITKYVGEELQLKNAKEEIEKNSAIMKKIVFQQSHLICAPLSNIIGLTTILDKTLLDSNTSNICDMILESTNQPDKVIRNIITTART